jgi:hypothetical protein
VGAAGRQENKVMLIDAIFRSNSLENPAVPITLKPPKMTDF